MLAMDGMGTAALPRHWLVGPCLWTVPLFACVSHPRLDQPPLPVPGEADVFERPGGVRVFTTLRTPASSPRGVVYMVLGPEIRAEQAYPQFTAASLDAGFAIAVLHPRGSGFSTGVRGDLRQYELVLDDLRWGWENVATRVPDVPRFLFGHSAGACLALEVAATSDVEPDGIILVNPAYKMRYSDGMGPSFGDYIRYGLNFVFRPAALTVDMNSDPSAVAFEPDRVEALESQADPLVVRYFSLRYLMAQKKVMDRTATNAARVEAPLLMLEGAHDALVDPKGTLEILEAAASADKEHLLAKEGGHGSSAVETSVEPLLDWLARHASAEW